MKIKPDHDNHHDEPNIIGNIGEHRTPIDTCLPNLEEFIKKEILVTKVCSCPSCNYRRKMFRAIQDILKDYKFLVNARCDHKIKCPLLKEQEKRDSEKLKFKDKKNK